VEILKDGAAIHAWDRKFGLGPRKVRIVLSCVEVLRYFWIKDGYEKREFQERTVVDPAGHLRVQVL
jgi:hypothetical protein